MRTVFSHLVQTRLSHENENVATAALTFILESSGAAREGMMKLLRTVVPELPPLWFRSQQTDGDGRPDMCGADDAGVVHVLIENKFWAGFTVNQPHEYIRRLSLGRAPTMLLVIAPHARTATIWRELCHRMNDAGSTLTEKSVASGLVASAATSLGPILAVTSWSKVLSFLETETTEEPGTRSDLAQLRALCDETDAAAFQPFSAEDLSDQRIPGLLLRLNDVVQESLAQAFAAGALHRGDLRPQADGTRAGRYANVFADYRIGVWFGVNLTLWKKHGLTPLWAVFSNTEWGRATEAKAILEPWAVRNGVFTASESDGSFAVPFHVPAGCERDYVVKAIVNRMKRLQEALAGLPADGAAQSNGHVNSNVN